MTTPHIHVEDECAAPDEVAAVVVAVERSLAALGVAPAAEVTIVLTSEAAVRALNHAYRGQDRPTDVLSFPADPTDVPTGEPPYLGDVIIAVPQAALGAASADHTLAAELQLLAVHGLLHLLGHEDESDAGAAEMYRLEIALGVRAADDIPAELR